jgi:YgiT-type zinc finger domain-containing protein
MEQRFYKKEIIMFCALCKTGIMKPGQTTVTLIRGETTVIIKEVPSLVCDDCGEYWLDMNTSKAVYKIAEEAVKNGTEVEIRRFIAA